MPRDLQGNADRPRSLKQPIAISNPVNDPARYDFIRRRGNNNWTTGHISMQELGNKRESESEILVVFLPSVADPGNSNIHNQLSDQFQVPPVFWSSVAQDANGFFGCQDTKDVNGGLEAFNSYFRFLVKDAVKPDPLLSHTNNIKLSYVWHKLGFYTTWTPLKGLVVLCFDLPLSLQHSLSNLAQVQLDDPFSFHTVLIEKIITLYDSSLWSWRHLVRDLEKSRTSSENPLPDYITMHELARHIIHSSETLAAAVETMASLIHEQEIFFDENSSLPARSMTMSKQTRRTFRSQVSLFKCLHLRSKALEERLRNEINLAFNTVAQHDSRIAVQIGKATQVDSTAMKTISTLGLAFLPGTFICALFSTSFFNFSPGSGTEPQHWSISEKFWIFWVIAIPVTVVTVICWISWQHPRKRLMDS